MSKPEAGGGSSGVWHRGRRRKVVQWGVAYAAGAWGLSPRDRLVPRRRGPAAGQRTECVILTLLFLVGGGLFWRYHGGRQAPKPDPREAPPDG